jgi:hypothetical protein
MVFERGRDPTPALPLPGEGVRGLHFLGWVGRDPTPTLPLPGKGVRGRCVLVPPPGKGEVRWGSILRSRSLAMLETRKSAYAQALGVKA